MFLRCSERGRWLNVEIALGPGLASFSRGGELFAGALSGICALRALGPGGSNGRKSLLSTDDRFLV
jgi:hypothetical protein